jgi:hypothetical protein
MKFYNDLPNWAKGVIAVGGVAIIGIFGFKIYQDIKRKKDLKQAGQSADEANTELQNLNKQGINPTITTTQATNFASTLVQAMNGCGTDENMINSVFLKMKNDADVYLLIKQFGVRYYTPCPASNPISYGKFLLNEKSFGGDLGTWLSYDLTASEIKKINTILTNNKIKYQF